MKNIKSWKGLNFTADTNCGMDWQSQFDIPGCPGSPNTNMYPGDPTKKIPPGPAIVNMNSDTQSTAQPTTPVSSTSGGSKKIPSWIWWVVGGLAAACIITVIKK